MLPHLKNIIKSTKSSFRIGLVLLLVNVGKGTDYAIVFPAFLM